MSNNKNNRIQFTANFDRYNYVAGQFEKQAVFRSIKTKDGTELLTELVVSLTEVEEIPEHFRPQEAVLFSAEISLDNIAFISSSEVVKESITKSETQNDKE